MLCIYYLTFYKLPLFLNSLEDSTFVILLTSCERGEWCRVAILKRVRERSLLAVRERAQLLAQNRKYAPLYAFAYKVAYLVFIAV